MNILIFVSNYCHYSIILQFAFSITRYLILMSRNLSLCFHIQYSEPYSKPAEKKQSPSVPARGRKLSIILASSHLISSAAIPL